MWLSNLLFTIKIVICGGGTILSALQLVVVVRLMAVGLTIFLGLMRSLFLSYLLLCGCMLALLVTWVFDLLGSFASGLCRKSSWLRSVALTIVCLRCRILLVVSGRGVLAVTGMVALGARAARLLCLVRRMLLESS